MPSKKDLQQQIDELKAEIVRLKMRIAELETPPIQARICAEAYVFGENSIQHTYTLPDWERVEATCISAEHRKMLRQ